MKKYVVLSCDSNPQYLFYLPLVVWAWRKFGWEPLVYIEYNAASAKVLDKIDNLMWYPLPEIEGYRSDTVAQCIRLYACLAFIEEDAYIMTSDIDMLPLMDYWDVSDIADYPDNANMPTTWGRDLTNYQHFPICYIAMSRSAWTQVMKLDQEDPLVNQLGADLRKLPQASSENNVERWVTDQDLITERLKECGLMITSIVRGTLPNGYPVGRVDRSAWSLDHPVLIDCHMLRDIWTNADHFEKTMSLLHKVWPDQDFSWFERYTNLYSSIIK